jgi:hypothetical protein
MKTVQWIAVAVVVALGMFGTTAKVHAQNPDAAAPSLQDLLKTQYKVTRVGSDSSGMKVLDAGTVVATKSDAIMGTEITGPHTPSRDLFGLCNNTFKNGKLTVKKGCASTSLGSKFLPVGFKMYITRFEVKQKDNKIIFNLVECAQCNGGGSANGFKAEIQFEFAPRFLDTAEPGQVADVIGQIFAPVAGSGR